MNEELGNNNKIDEDKRLVGFIWFIPLFLLINSLLIILTFGINFFSLLLAIVIPLIFVGLILNIESWGYI